ncbi:MAG TPA: carboxypeptidase regulatory-like domain-containing protein [Polyangia bacterium]|jgi:hypothetical protein
MKTGAKAAIAVVVVLAIAVALRWWRRSADEVTRAAPGTAWRVAGGIGSASATPTVAGVAVPFWFGQRGAPIRRVAGRVTFGGEPVANATVELASDLTDAGLMPKMKRRTAADGRFDFGTQPPAKLSVAATAEGRGPAILELDARNPTVVTDKIELRLTGCDSSLFGHVNDSSGGPIAAAEVCLAPPRASACVSADAAGAYSICLSTRQEFVTASAPGYGGIYERVEFKGRRMQRDFALTPEATIVGRVVRSDTNAPVAGASVRVQAIDHNMFQRFAAPGAATSDGQGKFTIAALAPGRQRLTAFAEGLTTTEAIDINVEAGRSSGEVLLRLRPAARLSGVVTDGRDPIVGATVSLGAPGRLSAIDAVTQADGSFILDPVARGRTAIFVRDYEVREPKTITIDRPSVTGVRVLVGDMGSIAGHVTSQGKPLAGARVSCGRTESVIADGDGAYIVRGLPPDKYPCYADSQALGAFGDAAAVTLGRGEHRTGVDIDVKYAAAISGVVVESGGKPVGGVNVVFDAPKLQDSGDDVSAPDGSFRVRLLKGGGDYHPSVRTNARNFEKVRITDGEVDVNVKDGATEVTGVRIVVQRDHLAITGSTVDGGGLPVSDVHVDAFRSDGDDPNVFNGWVDHPSATSAANGSFAIDDLDAGSFVLQARGGDGSEAIVRGIAAGQKGVVITLQRAGGIDGTLVGFSSPPAVQASRQLPGSFQPLVFATVEGSGFQFRGLNPGTYQVAAVGADTDAQMVEVSAGQNASVTLKSRGTATIHGRVVEWSSGAPVAGLQCTPGLRTTPAMPMWVGGNPGFSDESGAFEIDDAPAGAIAVQCMGTGPSYSNGRCELTVAAGQDAKCDVPVVKINQDLPFASIGAQIQPGPMPARFMAITPRGPADRAGVLAGDLISSIDGASVVMLTPMAVSVVLFQHPVGSTAHLQLTRGAQAVNADVILVAQ